MGGLVSRYAEALQLVEKVSDEAAASGIPAEKIELGISHVSSALLLVSEEQDALLLTEAAAVHTEDNTKEKRVAVLFDSRAFPSSAVALLQKLKIFTRELSQTLSRQFRRFCRLTCHGRGPLRCL